jgi:hypothetical protein
VKVTDFVLPWERAGAAFKSGVSNRFMHGVVAMANRSYLYSTNVLPGPDAKANGRKLVGIAEWNYDIPIVFKLLLSGNPQTCLSSIWDNQEQIALVGDYAPGVKSLEDFLSRIAFSPASPLIAEALDFLSKPENRNPYFILECGEIFDMGETPLPEQNLALLAEIKNLQPEIAKALQSLPSPPVEEPPESPGFFAKLFGGNPEPRKQEHDPMKSIYALGLGNWSNVLYFDFSDA